MSYNPQPKQMQLHECFANEILYGGAAGPGKSHALRHEGFTWANRIDGLQVYLFRRTYPELERNHILPSLNEFDRLVAVYRDGKRRWEFKNGSMIHFCHSQYEKDIFNYQGAEIHLLLIDELTTFTEFQYDYLRGRTRCALQIPDQFWHKIPGIICASNPGGVGHEFVKRRWYDFCMLKGKEPAEHHNNGWPTYNITTPAGELTFGMRQSKQIEGGMLRCYIPGKLKDNRILMESDPDYIHRLDALPEPYRTAYKEGDWDIFIGQMFAFSRERHVIKPAPVPEEAPLYMTFDWGFGAPFSCGWWWVDTEGRIFRFGEWYGWNKMPNQGLRLPDSAIAEGIINKEVALGIRKDASSDPYRHIIRLAGPDCFAKKPNYLTGGHGPTTSEVFSRHKLIFSPGDPKREAKIRQFHERLRLKDGELPMMLIYDTCDQFIRTIPLLQADQHNIEDVDTTMEDHVFDEAAHICMARPIEMRIKKSRKSSYDLRIERLERPVNTMGDYETYASHHQAQALRNIGAVDDVADEFDQYDDGQLVSTVPD